jgi:DNA-directed RNA polymerase subunit RPC12/RpoP
MTAYAYNVEGDGIICPECNKNPLYHLATVEEEAIGYPDGYTCYDCGTAINPLTERESTDDNSNTIPE